MHFFASRASSRTPDAGLNEDSNEHRPSNTPCIGSLDQFRGYTVAGMLLVNFVGGYHVVPAIFKHHNTYCSYADTIMPQFFFAVGFAYRLTFLRRLRTAGFSAAAAAVIKRNLGLILIGFVLYHLDGRVAKWAELEHLGVTGFFAQAFRRDIFQTLVHIAITSVWILPVIAAGTATRVVFMVASAAFHLWLSHLFYFDWAWKTPVIDGGQLGFLTWSIPTLVGSLAYDAVALDGRAEGPDVIRRLMIWSVVLMALGYGVSCLGGSLAPPPFEPPAASHAVDLWTMSHARGVFHTWCSARVFRWPFTVCLSFCVIAGATSRPFFGFSGKTRWRPTSSTGW